MSSLAESPVMPQAVPAAEPEKVAAGSSFYAGMRILPKAERAGMYAVYGFCRVVDDIADDQAGDKAGRRAELEAWRSDLASLYAGGEPGRAGLVADAVQRFGLRQQDFLAVLDGMQTDVDADVRAPTFADFDLYCDRVASAVGRLSVKVFGMPDAEGFELAHSLGRALQFTNVLRDLDEDAAIGRLYMPRELLAQAGIDSADPRTVVDDPRINAAAHALAAPGARPLRGGRPGAGAPRAGPPRRAAPDERGLRPHTRQDGGARLGPAAGARADRQARPALARAAPRPAGLSPTP